MAEEEISQTCPECGDAIIRGVQHECAPDEGLEGPPELERPQPGPQPWSPIEKENPRQYQVFCEFLKMPPPRSIAGLSRRVNRGRVQLQILAKQFNWWERTQAYDLWEINERVSRMHEYRKQATEMLLADEWRRREKLTSLADKLLERVEQYLTWPSEQVTEETTEKADDGTTVIIKRTVEPARWNMDTVVRMIGMVELLYDKVIEGSGKVATQGAEHSEREPRFFKLWQPDIDMLEAIEEAKRRNLSLVENKPKELPAAVQPVEDDDVQPGIGGVQ